MCISLPDSRPESGCILGTTSYARKSIQWYKLSDVQIEAHYTKPLCDALSSFSLDDDIETCFQNLTDTIWSVSDENLKVKLSNNQVTKKNYFRLPSDVNKVKVELNHLHKLWKDNGSLNHGMHFQVLEEKKAEYRCALRSFLTEKENENISHLCNTADVSEKLFWSMLKKSQGVGRKSSCFIVNDEIISGDNAIIEMWANHFEKLGMPGSHPMFNNNFRDTIEHEIKMILTECIETPTAMEGLFVYKIVKEVCTNLKSGVSGGLDQVTYEHLKYGGPKLWSILSILYFRMFYSIEVPSL